MLTFVVSAYLLLFLYGVIHVSETGAFFLSDFFPSRPPFLFRDPFFFNYFILIMA